MTGVDVSVVIPVLNAARQLPGLLDALHGQEPEPPREVVLVDSGSTDGGRTLTAARSEVTWITVDQFSHGRARNLGARHATGRMVVMLSQDALPRGNDWLARLLEPFDDERVAAAYSRQVPRADATPMERFFIGDRFPDGSPVRRERREGHPPGFEDVFFSNVSAAMRRDILLRIPFDEDLIMSEDQQFARDVLLAGHVVVYQPASVVVHSHRYTPATVFKRYFDSVYSLTRLFPDHRVGTSAGIARRYLARESRYIAGRYPWYLPYYALYCLARAGATVAAHAAAAQRLPRRLLRHLSQHAYYWE